MTPSEGGSRELVLGIDGGNSKVDVALAHVDGTLVGARRGPTISHQQRELASGMAHLRELVNEICAGAGLPAARPVASRCVASLAGADYPADVRLLTRAISGLRPVRARHGGQRHDRRAARWRVTAMGRRAGLRPGHQRVGDLSRTVDRPASRPSETSPETGAVATSLGMAALGAAVRAQDGRGPRTVVRAVRARVLRSATPGGRDPRAVRGEAGPATPASGRLAPLVFDEAAAGDAIARDIIERLATELAAMANALIRRLRMTRLDVEVVLAGGVFRTEEPGFYASLERQVRAVAPRATFVRLRWPPVAGAVLLAMEEALGRGRRHRTSRGGSAARWPRGIARFATSDAPGRPGRRPSISSRESKRPRRSGAAFTVPAWPTVSRRSSATPQGHLSRRLHRLP